MDRKMIRGIALLLAFLATSPLSAETFRFLYTKDDKYHIITEVQESIYINGQFFKDAEILNKISVTILDVQGSSGLMEGVFQVSERDSAVAYRLSEEVFRSRYWRDELGRFDIGPQYLMPIIRNVPLFPEGELEPGDAWTAPGQEVHDLRAYGMDQPWRADMDVHYTYLGREIRDGVDVAVFEIQYAVTSNLRGMVRMGEIFPLKIKGDAKQRYYWDVRKGRPYSYQDEFDYIYLLANGEFIEYEGRSEGRLISVTNLDRERMTRDIQREIEERGIEDARVESDEEGVTITLENINFAPDSAFLLPEEREKLARIAEILKKYPDRDLLIVGHTALAGTVEGRKQLSEERARSVGEYLLSLGAREEHQMAYQGVGASRPIADNLTEAGRRRNRRVEIKILEN